jgi:hypothetical protein
LPVLRTIASTQTLVARKGRGTRYATVGLLMVNQTMRLAWMVADVV